MVTKEAVEAVLDARVRPALQSHGGEVRLSRCGEGTVTVELLGACSGCPSADLSTRRFIEDALRSELPEVQRVALARSVSPELLDQAKRLLRHTALTPSDQTQGGPPLAGDRRS